MNYWGRVGAAACCALLLAGPGLAWADVVPARKAKADKDAAAIEARLATLGVDATAAKTQADRLTPAELSFFAEDTNRIQNVGGLTSSEWLGGGAFLALTGFLYFAFVSNQN